MILIEVGCQEWLLVNSDVERFALLKKLNAKLVEDIRASTVAIKSEKLVVKSDKRKEYGSIYTCKGYDY